MTTTRDSTALVVIKRDAKIGRSTETKRGTAGEAVRATGPSTRVSTTRTSTGTPTVPITPNGSRTKILTSSQVSLQSPRSMLSAASVANHVAGQLEKDVLKRRELRAEVGNSDSI